MPVDHTDPVDDAEKEPEQLAAGWHRPADRPGSEPPGMSRADSRAGAEAANAVEVTTPSRDSMPASRESGEGREPDGGASSGTASDRTPGSRDDDNEPFTDDGHGWRTDTRDGGHERSADDTAPTGDGEDGSAPQREFGGESGSAGGTKERPDAYAESPEAGRRWRTVAEDEGEIRAYASFAAARKDLGVRPGKELHHIVEQGQAGPERSGFSVIRINSTDNLVHLPADVHTEVSRHYSSRPRGLDGTVRDNLNGESWDDQYAYGQKAIDDAWSTVEQHRAQDDSGIEPSWHTVAEEQGEVRSYPSFAAARKDLGVRPGKELHHIVEQGQAGPERSGFSVIRINSTDNLVHLPADVHTEVSRHYSSRPRGLDGTVRDNLNGESWDDQYTYGQKAIDDAWRKARSEHD